MYPLPQVQIAIPIAMPTRWIHGWKCLLFQGGSQFLQFTLEVLQKLGTDLAKVNWLVGWVLIKKKSLGWQREQTLSWTYFQKKTHRNRPSSQKASDNNKNKRRSHAPLVSALSSCVSGTLSKFAQDWSKTQDNTLLLLVIRWSTRNDPCLT